MSADLLQSTLDALIERFCAGAFVGETARARAEYDARTGRVFEDDELYEARTIAFLEWYVLERPLGGTPPVVHLLHDAALATVALRAWATSHRSLFAIDELGDGSVTLEDLVGGGRFRVEERRQLHGVGLGDLVEARLVAWNGQVVLGRTFLYHPASTRPAVAEHARRIRAAGGTRGDIVDYVASLRVKSERYRHVAPERVYAAAEPGYQGEAP